MTPSTFIDVEAPLGAGRPLPFVLISGVSPDLVRPRTEDMADLSILLIEDDQDIRDLLVAVLGRDRYATHVASTGRDGLKMFHQVRPAAVILDVGLPDLDGWQVLQRIREMSDTPVLMLTAHSAERDKVRGLNAGADDYLTKPFSRVELLARLGAILRRQTAAQDPRATFDDGRVRVDFTEHTVVVDGNPIELTRAEFRLLAALVQHAGQVLSTEQLLELAWDDPSGIGPAKVKYVVLRLRRKLGWADADEEAPLRTVRGFGYQYRKLK